jgi:hypothetical protein
VLNRDALRDRKIDFTVMPQDELERKLQTIKKAHIKRKLLLTEVGYLRINLFQEYYERIQSAQKNGDPKKAVQLMEVYLETVAMPFIQERLHPSILNKISRLFSTDKVPNATKTLEEWKNRFAAWTKQKTPLADETSQLKQYEELKRTFITLYTISFSFNNFPPVASGGS